MANLVYKVSSVCETETRVKVSAREFDFYIDEPINVGGSNQGPNPVEFLLGSLAGCMSITARLVAKQMGIGVNNLKIDLEGDIDTSKFAGRSTDQRCGYKEIRLFIYADLDSSPQQKNDWLKQVKARCPVSDNLASITPIKIILKTE